MAKKIIANALSLNMVPVESMTLIRARHISYADVPKDAVSAIGHPDTARVVSGILGFEVPANRVNVELEEGDVLYVAQYKGPRLEEGATKLPEGATLEFFEVTIAKEGCKSCGSNDCDFCQMRSWTCGQ